MKTLSKAEHYRTASQMTDVQLVDERNKVFGAILSDPDDENSINAYDAINTVLADRYEAMVDTQRIIDKF